MRHLVLIVCAASLSGCSTVFDPAPYRPNVDTAVLTSAAPAFSATTILQFDDLSDAAKKLRALSDGYAAQRDSLMRQQLLFDLPMLGLAAGTVASGIYHGSKDLTLGLGLGSAGLAGSRLYFSPQIKVMAYNTAAQSLSCASVFASELYNIQSTYEPTGQTTAQGLSFYLSVADSALVSGTYGTPPASLSKKESSDLLSARDQAKTSYTNLFSALALLDGAPVELEGFTNTTVNGATNKIVTGTQNIDAALALIRAAPTTTPPAPVKKAAAVPLAAAAAAGPATPPDIDALISALQNLSSAADLISKRVNDKWATLATCAVAAAS